MSRTVSIQWLIYLNLCQETKFNTDAAVAEGSRRRHVNRGIGKKRKQAVGVDVGKLVISKCPVKVRQVVKVRWST